MKNNKGFTLIEILAVIIILGIIMLITIPAVSKYILSSKKSSYATDVSAFAETIKGEYEEQEYGSYIKDNEIMLVPLEVINLEKGNNEESPFGAYVFDKCYGVVVTERNGYQVYMNVVDDNGMGIVFKSYGELKKEAIEDGISASVPSWKSYLSSSVKYNYKGSNYSICENRRVKKDTSEDARVVILCKE